MDCDLFIVKFLTNKKKNIKYLYIILFLCNVSARDLKLSEDINLRFLKLAIVISFENMKK